MCSFSRTAIFGVGVVFLFLSPVSLAQDLWEPLVERLVSDGNSRADLAPLFQQTGFDPEPIRIKLGGRFESKFKAYRIRRIQEGLERLGYDPGPVDSLEGPATRAAIRAFQRKQRMAVTGKASALVLEEIEIELDPSKPRRQPQRSSPSVYKNILKPERMAESRQFLQQNRSLLEQVADLYGVPEEIAVAILAVETRNGTYLGQKAAFTSLASLAMARDYEIVRPLFEEVTLTTPRERWLRANATSVGNWAYQELRSLLEYAEHANLDLAVVPGSSLGAIGISQFMPSNALVFGVDGNQNGIIELFDIEDAVHSMANYLKKNGWRKGTTSRSRQARVLYRYNRSRTYVNTVLAVADEMATVPPAPAKASYSQ